MSGSALGRVLAGLALLAVGLCLGIVLGSVAEGPRLFVRRLTEPSQRVELAGASPLSSAELSALGELQAKTPPPPAAPPAATPEPPAAKPAPKIEEPEEEVAARAPAERPAAVPVPAKTEPPQVASAPRRPDTPEQQAAERVIAALREQRGEDPRAAIRASAPASGKVVQVAAYTDARAAEALARRLVESGYDSYVSHTSQGGVDRYRVRVRPGAGRELSTLAAGLKAKGLSVWVTAE